MQDGPDLFGCLLGIAVGDSIGLPFEGLGARKIDRRIGNRRLTQSLVFGRGMLSDDTEQSCLVLEAVRRSDRDPTKFQAIFAKKLKAWFLAAPAGVGLATVKACLKLLIGIRPSKSGVPSAGNGAAMSAPVLGVLFADNPERRREFTDASSMVTHTDQRALDGARIMAETIALSRKYVDQSVSREQLLVQLESICDSSDWKRMLGLIGPSTNVAEFARSIGVDGKVSGFVMQSVPIVLFIWLAEPRDARQGIETAVRLGGDTDTVGAMLGALYGASLGPSAFPDEWRASIVDFPRSTKFLKKLAEATGTDLPKAFWPLCLLRNILFLVVVLIHGLRRLIP